jgi:hypothetical protein
LSKGKRKGSRSKCYACDGIVTSREHVPPKCFFISSENGGPDQRKNLITIPSCDKHNLEKSGDDQYLLSVLSVYIENNELARKAFDTVITPTIRRRPWTVATFFKNMLNLKLGSIETGAFIVDRERFDRTAASIAKGIYLHHYKKRAKGEVRILTYNLVDVSSENRNVVNEKLAEWRKYSTATLAHEKRYGENQDTFYYQAITTPEGRILLRMVFYEGVVIDAYFIGSN